MRKAKLFFINAAILTATALIIRTIAISFNVYISNKIGPEGIGIFQLILSVYLFAITVASSGINIATTRLVTEELSKSSISGAKKVVKQCISYSLLFSLIASSILLLTADFIANDCMGGKISPKPLYFIAIGLPCISMSAAINGYFSALRKVYKTASSQIFEQTVKVIATMYLLSLFLPSGIEYACIALVIGDVISEIASFSFIFLLYKLENRRTKNLGKSENSYKKEIFKIAIPIALTSYLRSGLSTVKQLLIPLRLEKSGMTSSTSLAQYGIITGMVLPIIVFPSVLINSFSNLLIPEFSYYYAEKNYKQINRISTRIFKTTLIFSICVFGIFFTFSDSLSYQIYNSYDTSKYIMIIAPLVILMYIDTIVDSMLKGLNQQVAVMKCNILDLFVSIFFIYFLLPIFGVNGYIIVLYISEVLNTTISINQLIKISKSKINYIYWIIIPISGALLCRYIIKLLNLNINTSVLSLTFSIVIYIGIYIGYLFFTSAMSKKDLKI